jgi:hypothetical protein
MTGGEDYGWGRVPIPDSKRAVEEAKEKGIERRCWYTNREKPYQRQ